MNKFTMNKQKTQKDETVNTLLDENSDLVLNKILSFKRTTTNDKTVKIVEEKEIKPSIQEHNNKPKRVFELNLSPTYWKERFLYPFALDPAPLRLDTEAEQTA